MLSVVVIDAPVLYQHRSFRSWVCVAKRDADAARIVRINRISFGIAMKTCGKFGQNIIITLLILQIRVPIHPTARYENSYV